MSEQKALVWATAPMPYLFIDTNIYLSFFHFTKDDLEELKKLSALIAHGRLTLLLTDQVVDEFWRNRDSKIADMLKNVRQSHGAGNYPRLLHDYSEYKAVRELDQRRATLNEEILRRAKEDASKRSFSTDAVISELFAKATRLDVTPDDIARARERQLLGRPPGKKDSVGDALNWEVLLRAGPDSGELHLVSDDSDWQSALAPDEFHSYLNDEWRRDHMADVRYYSRLSLFFQTHFSEVRLAADVEAWSRIQALAESHSFAETHAAVAALSTIREFTDAQVNALARICIENGQVRRILRDADVEAFVRRVIEGPEGRIDEATLGLLKDRLSRPENDVFWDVGRPWQTDESEW